MAETLLGQPKGRARNRAASAQRRADVILVTGSSGFIGRALIGRLVGSYDVVGLDAIVPDLPAPDYETIRIDLRSDESVQAALARVRAAYGPRIASVVHLAAYFDLSGEPNPLYESVTVDGTNRLLRALRSFEIEQFIFASTMLVHAPTLPGQPIDEDSPIDPPWIYPQSKAKTEALLRQRHGDIPLVILRAAGVYDDRCHSAFLAQQIARIFEKQLVSHVYPGDAGHGQAGLHLDDLIDAVMRAVERRAQLPNEATLLLGEPEAPSYRELQNRIGRLVHGSDWETREIPKPLAKSGAWLESDVLGEEPFIQSWMVDRADDHYEIDPGRAAALLGWRPRHALAETLPKMIEALKADPEGWYRTNKLNAAKVAAADIVPASAADESTKGDEAVRAQEARLRHAHRRTRWAHFANMALGLWLATSPFAFGLFDAREADEAVRQITVDRGLPAVAVRDAALAWSDILCGCLIMLLAALSLSWRWRAAQWGNAAIGCWLLFAPLLFWASSASAYNNDTLVGALVIAFALLVAPVPGMSRAALADESDLPVGWTYNPSSHLQRLPIVGLAFIGLAVSRYLTAYQLGHIDSVWDPFFGDGTEFVISSEVSRAWPIADAGVGGVTYVIEILAGIMGDRRRWRTMPWLVIVFGLLIVPLGSVSIFFIVIQPLVIGTWCSLCLLAAAAMVVMIPFSLDELVATGQYLAQSRTLGRSFWRTFLRGGPPAEPSGSDTKTPDLDSPLGKLTRAFLDGGVTYPWTLLLAVLLGIWLMLTRLVLGAEGAMADSDHLVGCLVITVAATAMAEVARPVRFLNIPFGVWLVMAPWLLPGASAVGTANSIIVGLLLVWSSLPRGRRSPEHYGSWDRYVL